LTPALELIWQRVRRLNRYVEERAPWQLARDPSSADELDQTLASLAEGLRVVTVLLNPYMPSATDRLLEALGTPDTAYASANLSGHGAGQRVAALAPLFPKRA
jgi:methionyl-tRNA synthetase